MVYDVNQAGEAATRPQIRNAPFQAEHCRKLVKGFFLARGGGEITQESMHPGDHFVFADGVLNVVLGRFFFEQ